MKKSRSDKIPKICLLTFLFVFAICLGTQVAISQQENYGDDSVDGLISKYEQEAWENYAKAVEEYGGDPSVSDWRNSGASIDQPSGQSEADSGQFNVSPFVELGVFSLSGLSLLALLAIPKFGKKLLKRKLLILLIFVAFVAYGAFMAYRTIAQSNGGNTDIPATATYVIKTDGVNVWATRYDGKVMFNGTNAREVINNAIDATTNGGIVFIKAGTYILNYGWVDVLVRNKVKLIGEGYENTILKSIGDPGAGIALYPDYSEVRDLTVLGTGGEGTGIISGSNFGRPNGCKVLNCRIANWTSGIRFNTPAGTKHEFGGNIIENCVYGLRIYNGSNCIISNNIISETNGQGILLGDSQNIVVAHNTIKNWAKNSQGKGAIEVNNQQSGYANCENINIIGNRMIGGNFSTAYDGIGLNGEENGTTFVRGCSVTGNTLIGVLGKAGAGIYLHGHYPFVPNVQDCVISSNSIRNFNVGIQTASAKNIVIVGNVIVENYYHGMYLTDALYFNVIGNTVKNNGQGRPGDGIYVGTDDSLVSGNICIDTQTSPTQRYGINGDSVWSDNNFITGNFVKGNAVAGIAGLLPSNGNVITNNFGNVLPTAAFTFSPAAPTTADTVQFTDNSTDLDGTITGWSWSFGDTGTSTEQNPTHQYLDAGTYTVTLNVTDDFGDMDSCSQNVTVTTAPNYTLTISVNPPGTGTTDPSVGVHTYVVGTQVNITATAASGYVFDCWSGDASGSSPTTVVTMDSNKDVTANFKVSNVTYDFSSGAGIDKWAWYVDSDDEPPESSPNVVTELTSAEYSSISASDDSRYTSPDPRYNDEASLKCEFIIDEDPSSVTQIKITWEGYPAVADQVTIWVWNINTNAWEEKATVNCPTSDTTITATITTGISNYISTDKHIIFCVQNRRSSESLITDYVKIEITT